MSDIQDANSLERLRAEHRKWLAFVLIGGSYAIIAIVALAIVIVGGRIVWSAIAIDGQSTQALDKGLALLNNLIASMFPMVAAWIGAVIAYYFARENFEAAQKGAAELVLGARSDPLGAIKASIVMVKEPQMVTAKTTSEDAQLLDSAIYTRFTSKGMSRMIVLNDDGTGRGVLHDSVVLEFLANPPPGKTKVDLTLGDILTDTKCGPILEGSVVFVGPDATLAEVLSEMQRASATAPRRVRDVFVTQTGRKTDHVIGYLADTDIAKYGAYR